MGLKHLAIPFSMFKFCTCQICLECVQFYLKLPLRGDIIATRQHTLVRSKNKPKMNRKFQSSIHSQTQMQQHKGAARKHIKHVHTPSENFKTTFHYKQPQSYNLAQPLSAISSGLSTSTPSCRARCGWTVLYTRSLIYRFLQWW
jgi:hypothetical protein